MTTRRLIALLLTILLALAAGLYYLGSAPRLVETSPAAEAKAVPASADLRLVFSRSMDRPSVEARLVIQPPQRGAYAWEGNTLVFTPATPWPSGETIIVRLASGARTSGWLPAFLTTETIWSFTVERPLLLYLYPAGALADIYALEPVSGEIEKLTASPFGVLEFSASLDGARIYFSERNASGGSDIQRLERLPGTELQAQVRPLLACPQAFCRSPHISPDGRRLAFERNPLPGSSQSLYPQVWILELLDEGASGGAPREYLAGDPAHPTRLPSWSPQGQLAFYDVSQRAFVILDPQGGNKQILANETGEAGSWSPQGDAFVAPEIDVIPTGGQDLQGEADTLSTSQLLRYDLATRTSRSLSQGTSLEDTSPAFSPDGEFLAFARRYLDASRWTPGRQVWSMRSNGKDAQALTQDPYYNHTALAWSPDGGQLAYIRINQDALGDPPELWVMNADGSQARLQVVGGYAPVWIP